MDAGRLSPANLPDSRQNRVCGDDSWVSNNVLDISRITFVGMNVFLRANCEPICGDVIRLSFAFTIRAD
jgi:hypothetical protein